MGTVVDIGGDDVWAPDCDLLLPGVRDAVGTPEVSDGVADRECDLNSSLTVTLFRDCVRLELLSLAECDFVDVVFEVRVSDDEKFAATEWVEAAVALRECIAPDAVFDCGRVDVAKIRLRL